MSYLYITWTVDPVAIELGPLAVRWYGLLFALAFLAGYYLMQHILKKEGKPVAWMDSLLMYTMLGTVLGARLGHVFFYQWDYYQDHLLEIIQVWKGGLASHGAAIGIIVSLWLWSKKVSKEALMWILDRIVIMVALAAVFIRFGNLMNHEIVGAPWDGPWAFLFTKAGYAELVPRHPAQIYEALSYLVLFSMLSFVFFKTSAAQRRGLVFGLFLIGLFTARFFIEYVKEVQVSFEQGMTLNMGQWLSLPLIGVGLFFVGKALYTKEEAGTE
jgi:phosphatidylglycerol:prolipoprotein diacylglycerol transferase